MTVAICKNAAGKKFVIHNTCRNSAGTLFTLNNSVKNSSGTPFLIFGNTIQTVPVSNAGEIIADILGQIDTKDQRVFIYEDNRVFTV